MKGLVLRVSGLQSTVEADGRSWQCEIRGRLKAGRRDVQSPVATGDWVEFEPTTESTGVIENRHPRHSKLSRAMSGRRPCEQILAANVDCFAVVVAARQPAVSPGFIDRALVMAQEGKVEPLICLNKIDLTEGPAVHEVERIYGNLGYRVLLTSARTGEGIDELTQLLAGRVSALVGQSGVGKSKILNCIDPSLNLPTAGLMKRHDRGRHTTASVHLHRLPRGGYVADTPGVKSLQPWGLNRSQLTKYFVEMVPLTGQCRFRDCTHIHEPGCAIRDAVKSGRISDLRYEGFKRIQESLPEPTAGCPN
jgi:ribosome biogenesis GTPase